MTIHGNCLAIAALIVAIPLLTNFAVVQGAPSSDADDQANAQSLSRGDTRLRSNDVIKITVFGEDDLTTETRIEKDGTIRFPLLGSVSLAGKTVDEAAANIHDALGARFIRNPHVTLTIVSHAKQRLTILGEVKSPGKVEIPDEGGLDLLGAIALAGGFTDIADISHITVKRITNGSVTIIQVDAKKLSHDSNVKPFYVQPGDAITVSQRFF